jgi:hypothetical protein
MLFLEIVPGFCIGIAVLENFNKAFDNLLYLVLGELGTDPNNETGYFSHKGLPFR